MRTARRLIVVYFVPCFLAVALSMVPAAAQGELQFWRQGEGSIRVLGGITDDPGPFNRVLWTFSERQFENMTYIPREEKAASSIDGSSPTVQFNPVSGYAIAAWTAGEGGERGESVDRSAGGQDLLFSHFSIGGWVAPTRLAEGAADPSLLIDLASGDVHLVYWTPIDGGAVWHRQSQPDLTSWSDPFRVSDAREAAAYPTAHLHAGKLSIAYESHLAGLPSVPRDIALAQRPLSGDAEFTHTVLAETDYAGRNWVRLDSDDGVNSSEGRRRLLVRWVNAENEAGWILQQGGRWGDVGLMPLASSPGSAAQAATKGAEPMAGEQSIERVRTGR